MTFLLVSSFFRRNVSYNVVFAVAFQADVSQRCFSAGIQVVTRPHLVPAAFWVVLVNAENAIQYKYMVIVAPSYCSGQLTFHGEATYWKDLWVWFRPCLQGLQDAVYIQGVDIPIIASTETFPADLTETVCCTWDLNLERRKDVWTGKSRASTNCYVEPENKDEKTILQRLNSEENKKNTSLTWSKILGKQGWAIICCRSWNACSDMFVRC